MAWMRHSLVALSMTVGVVTAYGCGDDATPSSTSSSSGGSSGTTTTDSGAPVDSGTTDTGNDAGSACIDPPDGGTNPECGAVSDCGRFVLAGTDAADLPAGTSTTLPAGTYVLTAITVHKQTIGEFQFKVTKRFQADNTFQSIRSVIIGSSPEVTDERKSGTYAIAGGAITVTETCPGDAVEEPATFTVAGDKVTFFTPSSSAGAGAGVVETYTVTP